jgi:uroporphyrinogen III methyltransferase/synthase
MAIMTMQDDTTAPGQFRPLLGLRVMVTRPELEKEMSPASFSDPLAERLSALGAEVVVQPAIRIGPPPDWRPVDDALARLPDYDWLVFSSANGVRALLDRLRQSQMHPAPFPHVAAMGPGTADELARYGLQAELVPDEFRAESLAEALARDAAGKRFLLARASRGREVLAQRLTAASAIVEQIVVYTSTDVEQPDAQIARMLRTGQIDWITVTSSAIARSLARLFGDELRRSKLANISPITSGVLRECGYQPAAEATEYTLAGLAAAIVASVQGSGIRD